VSINHWIVSWGRQDYNFWFWKEIVYQYCIDWWNV